MEKLRRTEVAVGSFLLLFCVLVAFTQPVNPFPHDGWFLSQHRLFTRSPGGDDYTPIGAPAVLYASIHFIAASFGRGLEAEFYLGSLVHHVLLFAAGVFSYLTHRVLGLANSGFVMSALMVIFVQSTLLPQAFWSENVTLCLTSAVLFFGIAIPTTQESSNRRFDSFTIVLGLLLGALVVTRLVPIVILFGLVCLCWFELPRARFARFAVLATTVTGFVVLVAMSANVVRYGRFELSNSMGRHLWNVVSRRADDMLDQSPEYRLLLDAVPDAQGKPWWEIQPRGIESLKNYSREGLLRKLSLQAIRSHPVLFAKLGVENALQTFVLCPPRLGLDPAFYCNPLRRDSMLPPIATSAPPLDHFLSAFHGLGTRIYAYAVTGAVLLWCLMNVLARSRPTRQRETCGTFQRRVGVFLVFVLVATFYVSGQIERPNDRFVVPYLPVIALIVSTTVAMLPKSQRVLPPAGPPVG